MNSTSRKRMDTQNADLSMVAESLTWVHSKRFSK